MARKATDKNQKEIVAVLRKVGAVVKMVYIVPNLFDIIVFYKGNVFCVEVKNGLKSKLTPGEQKCKEDIETAGVKYWVVYSIEDALNMIGIK